MAELTARATGAPVLEALGGVARWLSLMSAWLAGKGAGPELVEQARQDVAATCRRLASEDT